MKDFTIEEARIFICDDFAKVVRRTKYLYVDHPPPPHIDYGLFEPILLCLCWCDFLGALYCGDHKKKDNNWKMGSTKRSISFIRNILGTRNANYRSAAADIVEVYRHGAVHAYAPTSFDIDLAGKQAEHLSKKKGRVKICVNYLLDDMLVGTTCFGKTLDEAGLKKFNIARANLG